MDPAMDPNGGQPVPVQKVDGHTGRDALLGGIAGHEAGHGHTARDAIVGGVIGHEGKEHREHQAEEGKVGLMDKIKEKF